MTTTLPFSRKALPIAILTTLLAACGGGSSDSGTSNVAPTVSEGTITGTASKGILQKAIVTAYKITDGKKGEKLGTPVTTGDNGEYSLKISGYAGAVLLEMTSDTNTKMLCDIPAGCESPTDFGKPVSAAGLTLQTVLPELKATNKTAITPFTHLAAKYAEQKGYNKANIEAALTQIADLFNLPALNETTPVNAAGDLSNATTTEQQYAVMNAAIAQLAGKVGDISAKLKALSDEINAKNGQLQSSGAAADKIDLADVLAAAKNVVESNKLNRLDKGIGSILAVQLEVAQKNTDLTTAAPANGAGLSDLAKAKAFVNSTSLLLTTLQQYDDQSFVKTLETKVSAIQALTDGDKLMPEAIGAVTAILVASVDESQASRTLGPTEIDKLLEANFNESYQLAATASSDLKLTIDSATNSATLNGELKLQRKRYNYVSEPYQTTVNSYRSVAQYGTNGQITGYKQEPYTYNTTSYRYNLTAINVGTPAGFTISNFKITYPTKTASEKDFVVAIDPNSKIKTSKLELSLATDSKSQVLIHFDNAATLQSHIDAADADTTLAATHIPTRLEAKLDRVTLKALNAGSSEFNQFVGGLSLTAVQANLDVTTGGKRMWPMPQMATLSGNFTGGAGDSVEATASMDLTGSNPKVSPEENGVRNAFYSYSYNSSNNTIILKPSLGTIGWNRATEITLSMVDCGGGQKRLSGNNDNVYLGNTCSTLTNVAEAYKSFISNRNYYWYSTRVEGEGNYIPQYAANFNYTSSITQTVNGLLIDSQDVLSEDSTHLGKATVTVNTKIKLVGNAAADIDAQITAKYAGQQNGEVNAVLRVGTDKLTIASPVAGGKPTITLSNQNGVSVEANILEQEEKIDIKVGGVVQGSAYKVNGLPVVKFIDNSLKAL